MIGISSDYTCTLTGLLEDGSYVNDATVTAVLTDRNTGEELYEEFDLDYVASSNGNYSGQIPSATTATLLEDQECRITITASRGGLTTVFVEDHIARYFRLT